MRPARIVVTAKPKSTYRAAVVVTIAREKPSQSGDLAADWITVLSEPSLTSHSSSTTQLETYGALASPLILPQGFCSVLHLGTVQRIPHEVHLRITNNRNETCQCIRD